MRHKKCFFIKLLILDMSSSNVRCNTRARNKLAPSHRHTHTAVGRTLCMTKLEDQERKKKISYEFFILSEV